MPPKSQEQSGAEQGNGQRDFVRLVRIGYFGSQGTGRRAFIFRALFGEDALDARAGQEGDPTGNVDSMMKTFSTGPGNQLLCQFERLADGEEYGALFKVYARSCEAFILIYDITSRESFAQAQQAHQRIHEERGIVDETAPPRTHVRGRVRSFFKSLLGRTKDLEQQADKGVARPPMLLVANKGDTPSTRWAVSLEEGQAFGEKIGAEFVKVSARTGEGCDTHLLMNLARRVRSSMEDRK